MFDGKYRATETIHMTDHDWNNAVILHITAGEVVEAKDGKMKLSDRTVPEDWLKGYEEYFERVEE
ncbi:hypothetical protein [Blautia sp.]|uniref:hypothetical protein n=1 Tax=Blautia sp. TaxID=1955243 RepID=UPI002A818348|nr:hypothetical protein [Blautia sp.]MDY4403566.1 hypothetical protein [Blautia sp.]